MPTMTTAEGVVESLIRHGLNTVYALPGVHNDPLFDAMFRAGDRLRVIHPRHEQAAAYMALGAALATGRPQAFSTVPGPGFLNAGAALLTAYGMNAPILGLIGQIPQPQIDRAHGQLHEIHDQIGLARHIAKYAERIRAPHEGPGLVTEALRQALSGRQRPVILECAWDMWGRTGAVEFPEMPAPRTPPPIDEDAVERAAKILGSSEHPMIVLGGGAQDAAAEVAALAEMLEAPVVGYRRGKGILPSSHRLSINLPVAHRMWKHVDAVVGIGTRMLFQNEQWGVDANLKVVRIDIDPEEPERFRKPDAALIGDAAAYVRALVEKLPSHNRRRASRTEELKNQQNWVNEELSKLEPQMSFVNAIRAALPEDGILVDEVTQIGFVSRLAFPVQKPRTFLSPGYQDNLGWGYGTALGAKAARPDVPVVAIAGDGGFMYQVGEMATAVQHKLAVVAVVFDNGAFGNVRLLQRENFGGRLIASELANPDFVKLAESFGMAAFRATDGPSLQKALTAAIKLDAPALIHVPCGDMPSPWGLIRMPKVRG